MITVMTIAGFDPSAGAGVLADVRTISAFGCYGVAAVTSITEQNTRGVSGAHHLGGPLVSRQIELLLEDFDVRAVKTGMLPTRECVEAVADSLSRAGARHLVVDPVMRATSGYALIDHGGIEALVSLLFPLASVVTPNADEAERLTDIAVKDVDSMKRAGEAILKLGPRAVLVKGGHVAGEMAIDVLVHESGFLEFSGDRIDSRSAHGTGCALSSAIACELGLGLAVEEAVRSAKQYVAEAIRNAPVQNG